MLYFIYTVNFSCLRDQFQSLAVFRCAKPKCISCSLYKEADTAFLLCTELFAHTGHNVLWIIEWFDVRFHSYDVTLRKILRNCVRVRVSICERDSPP